MIDRACIIPTGDELARGWVKDTSSAVVASVLGRTFPNCEIRVCPPAGDREELIIAAVDDADADLVMVSGGSGGGSRHLAYLAPDVTHSALCRRFPGAATTDIWGPGGHLWCRLVAAEADGCLVLSLPGPHVEAVSAAGAVIEILARGESDLATLADGLALGVLRTYPPECRVTVARGPEPA